MDQDEDLQGLENEDQGPSQEEVEAEARELGWVPQDKFRGNKEKWVPAEEFLENGKKLLPILRATNDRLKQSQREDRARLDTMAAQLQNANTAIERLNKHWSEANKQAVANARKQLAEELKQARENDDTDSELEILDKLGKLREAENTPEPKQTKKETPPQAGTIAPENQEWFDEQPWFGGESKEDRKRTRAFIRIGEDLRDEGETAQGPDFLDLCLAELEKQEGKEPEAPTRRTSKVGTPTPQARSNSQSAVKGWNDLPADAKKSCMEFADSLVGEGKAYKTLEDWKKEYVKTYHGQ